MKILIILAILFTGNLFAQNKAKVSESLFTDSTWIKSNTFNCKAKLISIEKTSLLACGYLRDWTTAQFKILTVNNKNIKINKTYTFYIPCSSGLNDVKAKKGETYSVFGIIKFPEIDSLSNSFKDGHPEWLWLNTIKK